MNIAVFASGRGSNFQAILNSIKSGFIPAQIRLLITNKADAGAIEIAKSENIPSVHISPKHFANESVFANVILNTLSKYEIDFIALAGYLKKIPNQVVKQFHNKIVNIHPALLPAFGGQGMYGHHVHEAVIASGVKISGATVHLVDEEYDHGPIVMQKVVSVLPDDNADTLAARVLEIEHEIYPLSIKAFAEGKVRIEGNKAWIIT